MLLKNLVHWPARVQFLRGTDSLARSLCSSGTSLRIGIFGGSGMYDLEGLENVREEIVDTPFGTPSDAFVIGSLGATELVFLPRHGRGHRFTPSEVNYRANVFGMKQLGVSWAMSFTAVGSLQEEIMPGHFVLPDSFVDKTFRRESTFFGNGIVGHVPFGHAVCETLREYLSEACATVPGLKTHKGGTGVTMEGPAFSTSAESALHRSWGAKIIGMTQIQEAKLCREAEISFAVCALATDYDAWRPGEHVSVDEVVNTMKKNVKNARKVLKAVVPRIAAHDGPCPMHCSLQGAIMTAPNAMPAERVEALAPLLRNSYAHLYSNRTQ